jgi:hypothetical protein
MGRLFDPAEPHFTAWIFTKDGADPDSRDDLGRSVPHRVSQVGRLIVAQSSLKIAWHLVDSGADMSATDEGRIIVTFK